MYPEFLPWWKPSPGLLADRVQRGRRPRKALPGGPHDHRPDGGTGGAKFVDGLRQVVPPEELTLIVNTGDDLLWWGLYVSPDIDSITYVLVGHAEPRARLGCER